ncbi:SHOCT domain-containing protein [Brevundimonas vesicularis]|uniref:SHOCT domain-containing protein n=1 Tax=Brevundimonas vesicularis TaxID=41276 RepID=A0ABU4KU68_BREVE|nr:SHOCT domain-containing protein [Brevundimonas vesicularis]MDX2336507.1 SHOCT domain-containing protein [Brevundimonas vesicularis]
MHDGDLEKLERLAHLLSTGALTQEEYDLQKSRILSRGASDGKPVFSLDNAPSPSQTRPAWERQPSKFPGSATVAGLSLILVVGGMIAYFNLNRTPMSREATSSANPEAPAIETLEADASEIAPPPSATPTRAVGGHAAGSFPMQNSYRFETATIQSISGHGTRQASMTGKVTRADATIYCQNSANETSRGEECVTNVMQAERGRTYQAKANCEMRSVTTPWGPTYLETGDGVWSDMESGENAEEGGMASGSASIPLIWKALCGNT